MRLIGSRFGTPVSPPPRRSRCAASRRSRWGPARAAAPFVDFAFRGRTPRYLSTGRSSPGTAREPRCPAVELHGAHVRGRSRPARRAGADVARTPWTASSPVSSTCPRPRCGSPAARAPRSRRRHRPDRRLRPSAPTPIAGPSDLSRPRSSTTTRVAASAGTAVAITSAAAPRPAPTARGPPQVIDVDPDDGRVLPASRRRHRQPPGAAPKRNTSLAVCPRPLDLGGRSAQASCSASATAGCSPPPTTPTPRELAKPTGLLTSPPRASAAPGSPPPEPRRAVAAARHRRRSAAASPPAPRAPLAADHDGRVPSRKTTARCRGARAIRPRPPPAPTRRRRAKR